MFFVVGFYLEPMKIVCAYSLRDRSLLEEDPVDVLREHEVVVVHTYEELKKLLTSAPNGVSDFAIVLTDIFLPFKEGGEEMMPTSLIHMYSDMVLIRGMGIFIPSIFESEYSFNSQNYHARVASKECWTRLETRDWRKLFDLVMQELDRIPL